jgi:hypothetical protein
MLQFRDLPLHLFALDGVAGRRLRPGSGERHQQNR